MKNLFNAYMYAGAYKQFFETSVNKKFSDAEIEKYILSF